MRQYWNVQSYWVSEIGLIIIARAMRLRIFAKLCKGATGNGFLFRLDIKWPSALKAEFQEKKGCLLLPTFPELSPLPSWDRILLTADGQIMMVIGEPHSRRGREQCK